MRIGLHTLSSPVNQFPDLSLHPAPYDWRLFQFGISRPPEQMTQAATDLWVDEIEAAGRFPLLPLDIGIDPAATFGRYRGRIPYYEWGNEPNSVVPPIDPVAYAAGLNSAYAQMRAIDPAAKMICGGIESWQVGGTAENWLTSILAAGATFDIVGVHLYAHGIDPITSIPAMMSSVKASLGGRTLPIWCTEFGVLEGRFRDLPRSEQYRLCLGMMRAARAGGCEAAIWYAADQDAMGFGCDPDELDESVSLWNAIALATNLGETMADHVRAQLRAAITAKLTGLESTAERVFQTRAYGVGDDDLPCLLIYFTTEATESTTIHGPVLYARDISITVQALARASAELDNVLDDIGKQVEIALSNGVTIAGEQIPLLLSNTEWDWDAPDTARGTMTMTWNCSIYTSAPAPDVIVGS